MRRFRLYLTALFSAILLLLGMPVLSASAAQVKLYDEGNRLSPSEFTEVENRLKQASDHTGMNIGVVLGVQERSDYTIESVCDSTYDELFGHKTDGLFYYMDLKGHEPYDYISTSGLGQLYYTNSSDNNRINAIYDTLDDYLYPVGSENVYDAVMRFAELVEYYYDQGVPENYYVYDDVYHEYYHYEDGKVVTTKNKPYLDWYGAAVMAFMAGIVGFIAALITFLAVKSRYKFKTSLSPTNYTNQKMVNYRQQYDNFVRESTSRVHIDTSSGSGGRSGGGGGGHSSGGHGGGGHHR